MLTLTQEAIKQVKEYITMHPGNFIRVGVSGGGCSGFQYNLELSQEFDETKDTKYEIGGQTVVVDKKSALYLDGTEIDYYDDGLSRRGFSFNNPNAVKSCGCGSSFSA
jgi:iron-sulfur cluster assembly protein